MKVVHLNKDKKEDPSKEEISQLEKMIRVHPTNEKAFQRLMILYRKKQDYQKELKTINTAIRNFEELYKKRTPAFSSKIKSLSKAISKATGLTDKKGNSLYEKGELAKWKRRKKAVLKKLKTDE